MIAIKVPTLKQSTRYEGFRKCKDQKEVFQGHRVIVCVYEPVSNDTLPWGNTLRIEVITDQETNLFKNQQTPKTKVNNIGFSLI